MSTESREVRSELRVTVDDIDEAAEGEQVARLVTDDEDQIVIPAALLPRGTRRGDVLSMTLARDPDETDRRRSRISELQRKLFGPE
jgi:hypothetical protein